MVTRSTAGGSSFSKSFNVASLVIPIVILTFYTLLGAFLFYEFESHNEHLTQRNRTKTLVQHRRQAVDRIRLIYTSHKDAVLRDSWINVELAKLIDRCG